MKSGAYKFNPLKDHSCRFLLFKNTWEWGSSDVTVMAQKFKMKKNGPQNIRHVGLCLIRVNLNLIYSSYLLVFPFILMAVVLWHVTSLHIEKEMVSDVQLFQNCRRHNIIIFCYKKNINKTRHPATGWLSIFNPSVQENHSFLMVTGGLALRVMLMWYAMALKVIVTCTSQMKTLKNHGGKVHFFAATMSRVAQSLSTKGFSFFESTETTKDHL